MNTSEKSAADSNVPEVRVEYDARSVQFASQFIVSGSEEGILLEFSGGVIADSRSGELVLPIQSRVGLTVGGARRLLDMLERALEKLPASGREAQSPTAARLPKLHAN